MITGSLLLLIIALAVAVGCYVGQKHLVEQGEIQKPLGKDYFMGLHFLLNEEPDKAVDAFTKLLQVDSDTVEIHLAIGNLFRRRGEISRAIRVHQNLIARPQLTKQQRIQALSALGKDYWQAGLVDRAERLFLEITAQGEQSVESLKFLREIYQQQRKWSEAIKVASQLKELEIPIGHYHCEMAQEFLKKNELKNAELALKQALKIDPACARANGLLAELAKNAQQFDVAAQHYLKIREQSIDYFVHNLPSLKYCYEQLKQEAVFIDELKKTLTLFPEQTMIAVYLAKYVNEQQFFMAHLKKYPNLLGLQYLIETHSSESLQIIKNLVDSLYQAQAFHRCTQCGFKSKNWLWQCPGCRSWSSIK